MDWSFSDNGLLQRHPVLAFARMKPEGPGLGFLVVRSVAVFGLRKYVWCLDMSAFLYLIVRMHRQASGQAYECMLRESLHINNQPTKTSVIMSACKHILESCTVCIYEYRHTHTHIETQTCTPEGSAPDGWIPHRVCRPIKSIGFGVLLLRHGPRRNSLLIQHGISMQHSVGVALDK